MNDVIIEKKKKAAPQLDLVAQLLEQVASLTKELADFKQATALPAAREKKETKKGQPREGVYYVVLNVPVRNFTPQAIACMKILARAEDPTHVSEADAMRLLEENKALLGTRQDSWRVFCYYRAKLIGADYLKMV
jgi:hypothetical protein